MSNSGAFRFPSRNEIAEFVKSTGLPRDLVVRDLVRIREFFNIADDLGYEHTVLTGGMALRLFKSTRVSLRDIDLAVVGRSSVLTVSELEALLAYQDKDVTITPEAPETWKKKDLYSATPLRFTQRFDAVQLTKAQSVIKVDVSLRGTRIDPLPMVFMHGYPFKLGVEGERVWVMHPAEMFAEKAVAYGIHRVSKHLADLTYMSTTLPVLLNARDWLKRDAERIRCVAQKKFEMNLDLHPSVLQKQEIAIFDDMRESFEHPERFNVAAAWSSTVFVHGQASPLYTYENCVTVVQNRVVPVLWPE